MDLVGKLPQQAEEGITTLEEGYKQMQTIVGLLMQRQQEGGEIDGGAISMDQWLEDRIQELLDILWELEEGPDPRPDVYIDWRRADDRLAACRTLFTLGRDLRNQLEYRYGLLADEDDCGENTNNSDNISYGDINDRDGVNNNNDGGGDVHGCSMMGAIQQVDAEDNGDVNNNNNHNNNNNINYSNNNKNYGAQGLRLGVMGEGGVKDDSNINNDGENNNGENNNNNNNNNSNSNSSSMKVELREERVTNHADATIDSDEYKGGDGAWWVDLMLRSYQVVAERAAVGGERKHAFNEAGEGET
ncbi:hypothetical protein CBR_g30312 [Chara braunii]|uniref:Uncharacterized protein n=1 Tax=Chara braunii TaxID=69332 RepID=A0A388JX58_CHABU|nr:hypothetical protein CBR_g30312 [Chara braunii]|eukprot:GBG62358.1 hypothetical protein CBR_g30312 [Chara braunii]